MTAEGEYKRALRLGRKQYQGDLAAGVYPYLQVLEELTQNIEIVSEVPLGVVNIQLDQVSGTNGHGRSTSFASNFMPLLDEFTEFSAKWVALCKAHLKEGLRDPIKCYEFMNRFYVIEGNKRVSVLKYFHAVEFQADVIRLVPKPDDTPASRIYQEFLKFYRITHINYLVFTKEGSYPKLLEVLGRPDKKDWNEEFSRTFHAAYFRFRNFFQETGGSRLSLTAADAFLEYVKIFPVEELAELPDAKLKENVRSIWEAYELSVNETPVAIQMQPDEETRKGFVGKITNAIAGGSSGRSHLKVAFVYDKTKETSSWTYGHEMGRLYINDVMADEVETLYEDRIFERDESPDKVLESLCQQKCDVIFTTTPRLVNETIKAAVAHPHIKFLNCSLNMAYTHIRTYYGRMYEAKFLSGLIAGCMTQKDIIAYVADYPISGMIAGINGFSRGVQLVNPRARIKLFWSTQNGIDLEKELRECGADLVSHQDNITPGAGTRHFGLYFNTPQISAHSQNGEPVHDELAMPLWNWGRFYERILRSIQSGSWDDLDSVDASHTINYWWGLSSGVIDLIVSAKVPEGVASMTNYFKKGIILRSIAPFDGIIKDQSGKQRSENDGYINAADIVTMDWLLDNIDGQIPDASMLNGGAQQLIKTMEEGNTEDGMTILKSSTERI